MKQIAAAFLVCILLTAVSFGAIAEQPAKNVDFTSGTPWPDIDLDGVVTRETPVSLKDNYALYVNKDAILSCQIPEGYPFGGTAMDINLILMDDIREMFLGEAPDSHDAKLAFDLFQLMMDWDSRNAAGVDPLKQMTDRAEAIASLDELAAYLTDVPPEDRFPALWSWEPDIDLDDASRRTLCINVPKLLMDDSAEYSVQTEYGTIKKEARSSLVLKMLGRLGYTEAEAKRKIENCLVFETMIAPSVHSNLVRRSPAYISMINNHVTRDELREIQGELPLLDELEKAIGYPETDAYINMEPAYVEKLKEIWTEENLPLLQDYMIVHGIISLAGEMDRESYDWSLECSNRISGSSGTTGDETMCADAVSDLLAWPVARFYTETYLRQEDKERITALAEDIVKTYSGIMSEAEWLSEETRANAIDKLNALRYRVLYPDDWEQYDCADLNYASAQEGGTYFDAFRQIKRYNRLRDINQYTKPMDKEAWDPRGKPNTVNCAYDPQNNAIYICGAFAQGGLYKSGMSDEELYARLGMVIGHEISHAFDSSGSQFDRNGNLADWWTEADRSAFSERNEKLAAYYSAMQPWEGRSFHGSIMTGEACADMGGMKCMLRIAAGKADFDYDAFFRSYAGLWLTKDSLQMAYSRLNDNHPMPYLRINATLQQFDEFLDFYGIAEGDGMYLAPEDRVNIW